MHRIPDMPASTSSPHPFEPSIPSVVETVLQPSRFFAASNLNLKWVYDVETIHWELFRGRVLDRTQTRQTQTFRSWSVRGQDDDEPWISIKWHPPTRMLYVVRSIRCRSQEAYEEDGMIRTRPVIRRIRELVGSISLDDISALRELEEELSTLVTLSVVGTHRLPITSLETPMPEYSVGLFSYSRIDRATPGATMDAAAWLSRSGQIVDDSEEAARVLEFALRSSSPGEVEQLARDISTSANVSELLRIMFLQVSLTPYTDFTSKVWQFTDAAVAWGKMSREQRLDFYCWLLRLVARHLSSFDLVQFHHRGANYPDALLIEELAERLGHQIDSWPTAFLDVPTDREATRRHKRLRRRAVRQAWLIRRENAGRVVPKQPTTPGESLRVLPGQTEPPGHAQVQPAGDDVRRIFDHPGILDESSPTIGCVLRASIGDLENENEQRELGLGLFLDRPLGIFKQPGEPDATLLFVHECFSPDLAARRREALQQLAPCPEFSIHQPGVDWHCVQPRRRPGVVSLQDIQLSPHNFRIVRTARSTLREFWRSYDLPNEQVKKLADKLQAECVLILPCPQRADDLLFLDEKHRCRLRARMESSGGYRTWSGREYLAAGFTLVDVRDEDGASIPGLVGSPIRPTRPEPDSR